MSPPVQDLHFSDDFAQARRADGSSISFTRSESRALSAMARNAGRLLTRNQLLDAISEPGSEKNDRAVDFLINRLRRKLDDSAKDPRFIATRYGEGYVWVAKPANDTPQIDGAFLVIGPFRGREVLGGQEDVAPRLARHFADHLRPLLRPDQSIVIAPEFPARWGAGPTLAVDLTFFRDSGGTECVVSARALKSNRVHYVTRFPLPQGARADTALSAEVARIAPVLLARSWRADTAEAVEELPLPVAMHEAANPEDFGRISWPDNDNRLRALRAEHPDDPGLKLLYATHLHTKYITRGRELFYKGEATCAEDEAQIERLVLASLDHAQGKPELAVMAAKLLYFVDRGYKSLALELAERALKQSTAVASSLAVTGQLRGFTGDIDGAIESLQQAKALSTPGSHFNLYVLVMLCQAAMAGHRREALIQARAELYKASALASVFFEPMFSDPEVPSLRAKGVALMLGRGRARAILRHLHYVSARLYEQPLHRENALRTPVNLFVRRFGREIVPQDVAQTVPGLLR